MFVVSKRIYIRQSNSIIKEMVYVKFVEHVFRQETNFTEVQMKVLHFVKIVNL